MWSGFGLEGDLKVAHAEQRRFRGAVTDRLTFRCRGHGSPLPGTRIEGFALQATTGSGATSAARAVRATATNSGSAIEASATGGYALIVSGDTTAPAFGEIHFTGQNADPTDVVDGSMQWNTTERQFKVSDATDIAWRGVWTSLGGFTHGHETTVTQSAIGNPVWNVAATAVCDGSNAPKVSGRQVILRFACEVRNNAAGVQNTLNVRLKSNGSVIVTRAGTGTGATAGYFLNGVSTDWQRSVVLVYAHTLSSGDHTFTAEIQSALGNTLIVRDASLTVDGLY